MSGMKSGSYTVSSDSVTDTDVYGYLYKNHFNPLDPTENFLFENDDGCGQRQFKFDVELQSDVTYILVITTIQPETTGEFIIFGLGPSNLNFIPISEYNNVF